MAYISGDNIIKQVKVGTLTHEVDAKYFAGQTEAEWKAYIAQQAELGFEVVVSTDAATTPEGVKWGSPQTTGTLAASESVKNTIYFVPNTKSGADSDTANSYDQYLAVRVGTAWKWQVIGATSMDLSAYAKRSIINLKGNITGVTATATGSAGAISTNTGSAGGQTATGSVSVNINKLAPTSTGVAALSGDAEEVTAHAHTLTTATMNVVTGLLATTGSAGKGTADTPAISESAGSHTHSVTTTAHSHAVNLATANVTYVSDVKSLVTTASSASTGATKGSITVTNGVLSMPTNVVTGVNASVSIPSVSVTGTVSKATFTNVTGITLSTTAPSGTAASSGSHSHEIYEMPEHAHSLSGKETKTTLTYVSGTQTGSAGAHSHSVTIPDHSHTITPVSATVTGSASVAISSHTHSISVAAHTHKIDTSTIEVSVSGNNYVA